MASKTFALLGACVLACAPAGCRFGDEVEPLPISGAAPETVAIWPVVVGAEPPDAELWFAGLSYQLGSRGYRVIAPGVTRELLAASDLVTSLDDAAGIGRALLADAVLQLEVRELEADREGALQRARWDVGWRLLSTRGDGQQWAYANHGRWRQADRDPLDSSRSFDIQRDPPPIVPIGGPSVPDFRDLADLMAHLHRDAMRHLPERARP